MAFLHSVLVPLAWARHCFLMEIRILSQDCCCLGFALLFILALYSPPCGNTLCSLFSPRGNLGRARGFGQLCSFGDIPATVKFQQISLEKGLRSFPGIPWCCPAGNCGLTHTGHCPGKDFPAKGSLSCLALPGKQSLRGSAGIRAAAQVLISLKDGFSPFGWN